ncbi:MAG: cytidine deaminase [Chloroflexota bacterium]
MNDPAIEAMRDTLIEAACAVRANAYVPYSHYAVGAAILMDDGRIFTGVNIENASYGGTVCAERTAVFKAVSEGARQIRAIAVCTANGVAPCGLCRQVLAEFASPEQDPPVWMVDEAGMIRETTLFALLPDSFGPQHLHQD